MHYWRADIPEKINPSECAQRGAADLQEARCLVELLHGAVAHRQVTRVRVRDDYLQGGCVHIPQVDVCLFALTQSAHKHGPTAEREKNHPLGFGLNKCRAKETNQTTWDVYAGYLLMNNLLGNLLKEKIGKYNPVPKIHRTILLCQCE